MSPRAYQRALAALHDGDRDLCFATGGLIVEDDYACGPAHLLRGVSARDSEVLLSSASLGAACRYSALDAEAWFNRAVTAEAHGRQQLAIDCYRRAHALDPTHVGTLLNGAQLLRVNEYFEEAMMMARKLQRILPDHPAGYSNEAIAAIYLGDIERSDWAFSEAIRLSDDPSLLLWEQHFSLLARGRFAEAWQNYEHRFACSAAVGVEDMAFALPRWDGKRKRHVIGYGEQGLGDQIMFASVLPDLARDCDHVSLAVSPPLVEIFAASFPGVSVFPVRNGSDADECARVVSQAGESRAVNACLPLGSLLTQYRNERIDFPGNAFLCASDIACEFWDKAESVGKIGEGNRLKVGVCWASNPAPERFFSARRALHKTMPLSAFEPLIELLPDADFVAMTNVPLNHFEGPETVKSRIADVSGSLINLDRTAALLKRVDLLITVDTGVAHLAGALGVPVWILLHHHGDARWGLPGVEGSYWYNSARLFWQRTPGDWAELIARVRQALKIFANDHLKQVAVQ